MRTQAPNRMLSAFLALAAAALACARAEVPIDSDGHSIATAIVLPATPTVPDTVLASPTSPLAEATQPGGATATASATTPATATPGAVFDQLPILNGTFDTDLGNWNVTPNWALWQDGYARLNAGQAGAGAVMVQFTTVPRGREVKLHFTARSETALSGECIIETHRDSANVIPADGEWHEVEVEYTSDGGTQTAVSLQARNNNHCDWLHFDNVYWLVAADSISGSSEATAEGAATLAATEAATATDAPPTALPTVGAIPAGAAFTQDFTVSAVGDTVFGAAGDIIDDQAITWASLRAGTGAWLFDLGSDRNVAGLRLRAHRDGDQDTTLLGIDVSTDGAAWTTVYTGSGDCAGTANCEVLTQGSPVDLAFGPTTARYVRVRSGPTRFALAEVEIALIGN
jgi:hypothetical protein